MVATPTCTSVVTRIASRSTIRIPPRPPLGTPLTGVPVEIVNAACPPSEESA
ncbi:MAG TPA: hypothetical protein VF517_09350 [Thermoleophilaceae bacterium]|jgi:hypothetical protein